MMAIVLFYSGTKESKLAVLGWRSSVQVGDLVTMDCSDWPGTDAWGVGIVIEINKDLFYKVAVLWSKIGLSWEESEMLKVVSET
jgi:hypothetical protein